MSLSSITGKDLVRGVKAGCIKLEHNRDRVDLLNVFPVPDGDTGTNMYLTLLSAVKEGEKSSEQSLGKLAKALSTGSLMGARGNSGVILSQVFRGFAKMLEGKEEARAMDLAQALKMGSDTAYEAVMKPVEGTILTVIREVAKACEAKARQSDDILAVLLEGIRVGERTLEKTPTMLPILKEAGVVDAGGQGLIYFLQGMVEGVAQEKELSLDLYRAPQPSRSMGKAFDNVQLEYQYCTELLLSGKDLDSADMKDHLAPLGDSMLVVGEDELIKVHIHSNHPGKVLDTCLQWGSLSDIKINNMLEETHEHLLLLNSEEPENKPEAAPKKIGVVAVAAGEGMNRILDSLGVDQVVWGGQTMNPSTEDLLQACKRIKAENIIILPNNGNVILAAQQVQQFSETPVYVLPTRSVVQGISAMVAYEPDGAIDAVKEAMAEIADSVKYAEITRAVRDSHVNGIGIKEGDIIGLVGDKIVAAGTVMDDIIKMVLEKMLEDHNELISVFYGEDTTPEEADDAVGFIKELYPDCEIESHFGGQPHYNYLIAVE
ncbi:MAG: DAK2 domain-containing protein [Syntrophomonas sp.]